MKITGEMQIDLLHRYDLRIATARCAPLHTEAGTERRLAQADHGFLADAVERIAKPDCCRRFALTRRRRVDRCHQNEFAIRPLREPGNILEIELSDRAPIRRHGICGNPGTLGDCSNGQKTRLTRDFDIRRHAHSG